VSSLEEGDRLADVSKEAAARVHETLVAFQAAEKKLAAAATDRGRQEAAAEYAQTRIDHQGATQDVEREIRGGV
jgi:hypothetical protein